jgi:hypothetical protein
MLTYLLTLISVQDSNKINPGNLWDH